MTQRQGTPAPSISLPVRLPDRLIGAVRAEADGLQIPAASLVRGLLAVRYEMSSQAGRHWLDLPDEKRARTVEVPNGGATPSQALQLGALILVALGQQTDALRAAGDAVPPEVLAEVRATAARVVTCMGELR